MKLKVKLLLIMINILLQGFDKLTSETFAAKLLQATLASKPDIPDITDFVKKTDFDNKLISFSNRTTSNKTKDIAFKTKLYYLEKNLK